VAAKEVIIYGAGMSGMLAAYNLVKEDRAVLVRDRESGFGGSKLYNPSLHTTPIDLEATSQYVGIDISPGVK